MPATVRYYEVVYVIAPDKTDEQNQAIIDKYTNLIVNQGGTIDRTDVWERRRLAYEINGYNEGIYIVTTFHALPKVEAELRRVFRISEDTLRSIVIRPDEETVPLEHMARGDFRPSPRQFAEQEAPAAVAIAVPTIVAEAEAPAEETVEPVAAVVAEAAEPVDAEPAAEAVEDEPVAAA